jgi:hypothetical protein
LRPKYAPITGEANQMAKKRKAKKTKIKRKGTPNKNKPQKKWSTPKVKKWLPAKDDALIVE